MYAVVTSGGKQYRVEAGNELLVERVAGDPGASVTFDRVLLVGDGDSVTVGTPTVSGATVSGTVLGEALGPKLIIFKFKQKATYRRKNGHRQHLTRVRIDEISAGGRSARATEEAAASADDATASAPAKPATRRKASAKAGSTAKAAKPATAAAGDEPTAKPAPRRRSAAKTKESEE